MPYGLYLLGATRGEEPFAYVVSWVAQTSFKPPMLVVGMGRESHGWQLVKASGRFSLNFLASDQKDVAKLFFKDAKAEGSTINGVRYERGAHTGCPVFPDLPAHVECVVEHAYEGENDHAVVVARVVDAQHRRDAKPLTTSETGWTYAG